MRALAGWVLALSLVASPALAAGNGEADSTASAKTANSGSTASAAATTNAPSLESEIGDLRDLIDSQANQLDKQNDQLQQEQKKLEILEQQLKASNAARESGPAQPASVSASDPASSPVATASVAMPTVPAASSSAPSGTPSKPQGAAAAAPPPSPLFFKIGVANFTPLGFMDLTDVFRSPNIGSGIGTNFAQAPYRIPANFPSAGLTENRLSIQNSRLGIRIDAPVLGGQAIGYLETDFLGNAPTNLSTTSNSAVLRLRVYFIDYTRGKFEMLAGQDWSMLTPNRVGINPIPGNIFFTQNVDTNYQVGLVWERVPQFRLIYHASKTATFGLSIENADQYLGGNGGVGTPVIPAALSGTSAFSTAQFDTGASATNIPNVAPDVIVKAAFDPMISKRAFHFEVSGLYKTFRANTYMPPATGNSGGTSINDTMAGGGVSANINFEVFKNFHLIANSFYSDGGGQKIFDLAPDVVIHPQANTSSAFTIQPLHSGSGIGGAEWQVKPKFGVYGYYGAIYVSKDSFACGASFCGYGVPATSTSVATAESQNRIIQEGTVGFIPVFWRSPNYGALQLMTQFSYFSRAPWSVPAGTPKIAHDAMAFVNLRYVLP